MKCTSIFKVVKAFYTLFENCIGDVMFLKCGRLWV